MSYVPPARLLHGLPVATAQKFGMPNIGAMYTGSGVRKTALEEDALCSFCRKRATNAHHVPNVGMSARNARFELHGRVLRPALIALCGSGTTGCHGDCHNGRMAIEWRWDSDEYAEAWWSGGLLEECGAGSPLLYEYGAWYMAKPGVSKVVRIRA